MAKKTTAKKKTAKQTIDRAHKIADAIKRSGGAGKGANPYAIGMASAKRAAAKRARARKGR